MVCSNFIRPHNGVGQSSNQLNVMSGATHPTHLINNAPPGRLLRRLGLRLTLTLSSASFRLEHLHQGTHTAPTSCRSLVLVLEQRQRQPASWTSYLYQVTTGHAVAKKPRGPRPRYPDMLSSSILKIKPRKKPNEKRKTEGETTVQLAGWLLLPACKQWKIASPKRSKRSNDLTT